MSKHSEGPWTVEVYPAEDTESGEIETVITCYADADGKEGAVLATVNRWEGGSALLRAESEANARLMAAAPDLRAALVELLDAYEDGVTQCHCARSGHPAKPPCTPCRARAAIARADGG